MVAVEVPDGLAWILTGIILTGIVTWGAWVTKQMLETARMLASVAEHLDTLDDHESRIRKLEGLPDVGRPSRH